MKKAILLVFLGLSMAVYGFSYDFSIRIAGGFNSIMGGDFNSIMKGTNDYWRENCIVTGDLKPMNLSWNFGAEFILNFGKNMAVGLGSGFIAASNESTRKHSDPSWTAEEIMKPSVSAIPVSLNFHYFLPLSSSMNLHLTAGPSIYISRFKVDMHGIDDNVAYGHGEAFYSFSSQSRLNFGFQGGIGIELALNSRISLVADFLGRMASLSGFKGDGTAWGITNGIPWTLDKTHPTFWFYEYNAYGKWFAFYSFVENKPSSPLKRNVREGSVSLSGIGALVGVKINL